MHNTLLSMYDSNMKDASLGSMSVEQALAIRKQQTKDFSTFLHFLLLPSSHNEGTVALFVTFLFHIVRLSGYW